MKELNNLVKAICNELGLSDSANIAKESKHEFYYHLEYALEYGGYRLVKVKLTNGAHYGAFGGNGSEPRLKASLMLEKLKGILAGIQARKIQTPVKIKHTHDGKLLTSNVVRLNDAFYEIVSGKNKGNLVHIFNIKK